jgi:hypothetical protein
LIQLEYNFYILPLAFAYNFKTLAAIDCDREPEAVAALLRSVTATQEAIQSSECHLACEISTELRSAKKSVAEAADMSVIIAPTGVGEIVYRTQPLTDKYPLSYGEVIEKVRAELPQFKQPKIDEAMKSLKLKGNPAYSAHNFRTEAQQEKAAKEGRIPKGLPLIYNEDAVRILIHTLQTS